MVHVKDGAILVLCSGAWERVRTRLSL
uniref:Uncharacterized protein n=1 Tax=Anguilla anguilla TaxID=7936 RepID=A0A0E9XFK2_ANGAN